MRSPKCTESPSEACPLPGDLATLFGMKRPRLTDSALISTRSDATQSRYVDAPAQPAGPVTEARGSRKTVGHLPSGSAAKVLLVDDDMAILDGVSEFLEAEGFSVALASNGIDALNQLRSGLCVDVIVLDLLMPMMDGWEFRAEQLIDRSLCDTPVVVISASGLCRRTLQQQFDAHEVLPKPLDLIAFSRTLRDACGGCDGGQTSPAGVH